jgi:hypothetical protein
LTRWANGWLEFPQRRRRTTTEEYLPGRVGGAVLIDGRVHRPTGYWTPAVHDLLRFLSGRLPHVPELYGLDHEGREVLEYLPGTVIDLDNVDPTDGQLVSLVKWSRQFHDCVSEFTHPGPWRYFHIEGADIIGHNDIAPYNSCYDGDELVGVFDWDLAGPTTRLAELAFIAWNVVPLHRELPATEAARRLTLVSDAYGMSEPQAVLEAVPWRITIMLEGIVASAAAGDQGMKNVMTHGEPQRSQRALDDLVARIPEIRQTLTARHP